MGGSNHASSTTTSSRRAGTVLVVEDSELFRRVLTSLVRSLFPSVTVVEADDAPEGLAQARRHHPDVIFMDISLPSGNGLELTEAIVGEIPAVTVIVCTNHDTPEYREAAAARGAAHFVTKEGLTAARIGDLLEASFDAAERRR